MFFLFSRVFFILIIRLFHWYYFMQLRIDRHSIKYEISVTKYIRHLIYFTLNHEFYILSKLKLLFIER